MTTRENKNGMVIIDTDEGHVLHRKGDRNYEETRHVSVRAEDVENYEELTNGEYEAILAERDAEERYTARVEALIRERYTVSDELAILRQRNSKPDEFALYETYAERCKAQAREEIFNSRI